MFCGTPGIGPSHSVLASSCHARTVGEGVIEQTVGEGIIPLTVSSNMAGWQITKLSRGFEGKIIYKWRYFFAMFDYQRVRTGDQPCVIQSVYQWINFWQLRNINRLCSNPERNWANALRRPPITPSLAQGHTRSPSLHSKPKIDVSSQVVLSIHQNTMKSRFSNHQFVVK